MAKRRAISPRRRFEILKRDGFKCRYCGKTYQDSILEVDHVVAVANGGTNDDDNLVTACYECNHGKAGLELPELEIHDEIMCHSNTEELYLMGIMDILRHSNESKLSHHDLIIELEHEFSRRLGVFFEFPKDILFLVDEYAKSITLSKFMNFIEESCVYAPAHSKYDYVRFRYFIMLCEFECHIVAMTPLPLMNSQKKESSL